MSRQKRPVIAIGIDGDRREYDSVWEAHEDGFHYPKIYRCLKKHSQTHKGYHWRRPAEGKQAEPPNLEEALAWIAEATTIFAELAGGGPDLFTRRGDDFRADVHICRSRILSALTSYPVGVPKGWQLVPVKMTADMINAWSGGVTVTSDAVAYQTSFQDAWKRVLIAAPSSPGKDGGQEVEAVELIPATITSRDGTVRKAFVDTTNGRVLEAKPASTALVEAARFLADRLEDFRQKIDDIDDEREFEGHIIPALARLRAALGGSHE